MPFFIYAIAFRVIASLFDAATLFDDDSAALTFIITLFVCQALRVDKD